MDLDVWKIEVESVKRSIVDWSCYSWDTQGLLADPRVLRTELDGHSRLATVDVKTDELHI